LNWSVWFENVNCFDVLVNNPFFFSMIYYFLSVYHTSSLRELTCWQKKSGADLFPDVSTPTVTTSDNERIEDEMMKLAIMESLETYEAEKVFRILTKAKYPSPPCFNPK
jgi:hypothetical protein